MNPAWLLQRKHVEQKNSQKKKPAIFLNVLVGPMLASKGKTLQKYLRILMCQNRRVEPRASLKQKTGCQFGCLSKRQGSTQNNIGQAETLDWRAYNVDN